MGNSPTTQTCNVLVIGAGGAGLSAAIEARTKGLSVIVCGKRHREDAHTDEIESDYANACALIVPS